MVTEPGSELVIGFQHLLTDLYEFVINEARNGPFQQVPFLSHRIAEHQSYRQLLTAIGSDRSLTKFFPTLRADTDRCRDASFLDTLQSVVIWSDASSEGISPLTLCSGIIADVFRFLWSWSDNPSREDALKRLPYSLQLARDLAEKRIVKIPAVISIHNIDLGDNDSIEIGAAVLRKPTRYDKSRLFFIARGEGAQDAAVLRLDVGFSALHVRAASENGDDEQERQITQHLIETQGYPSMDKQAWLLQNSIDRARLAIVLSSRTNEVFAPVQGWNSVVNPLSDLNHAQISNAHMLTTPYAVQAIDEVAKQRILFWGPLVERYAEVLRTGIRRLLLAVTERMYAEDGFVDAIICWENLFSGAPETTLRVCGAMAKLLEPEDGTRRIQVYRNLATLYNKRSAVVHGSSSYASRVTAEDRDNAVAFTLEAFRAIYGREDLLTIPQSPERGRLLLLE